MPDKTIKKLSRNLNKGTYLRSFSIVIFYILQLAIFAAAPQLLLMLSENTGLKAVADSANQMIFPAMSVIICLIITAEFKFSTSSLHMGENAWYSGRLTRKKLCGKRLRFWFRLSMSFKALRLNLILFVLKALWTAALLSPALLVFSIIAGTAVTGGTEVYFLFCLSAGFLVLLAAGLVFRFIIFQQYYLAPYLMAENPKLKPLHAVRQSKNLLEGHILRIVSFKIKFFPLFLLYPLVFPAIFIHPHYKQCCSVLAKEISL